MADVSVIEASQVIELQFKRPEPAAVGMKRKTPSEIRAEQLKRRSYEKPAEKVPQPFKVPSLVNSRVTQVYPIVKSVERCRPFYWKGGSKVPCDPMMSIFPSTPSGSIDDVGKDSPMPVQLDNCSNSSNLESLEQTSKGSANQAFKMTEKCIESALVDVVQLHLRDEKPASPAQVDMEKALKGFRVPRGPTFAVFPSIPSGSIDDVGPSSDICPLEISVPGKKAPLDLTLKTSLRLLSSSSVKWCHRIDSAYGAAVQSCGCSAKVSAAKADMFSKSLSSWIYPQSVLPTPIISAMASSKAKADVEFLEKRWHGWEDSFRNLYCMLRKNLCSIFYVYTSEFVALFVGGNFSGEKRSCSAYLSKSTNSLRSVLRRHDVRFTMPLYHVEDEQASADDLAELSEIEKRNLGQAVYIDHFAEVDSTSQSLLSCTGNKNVHGLYDFLLNYRFLFTSLNGGDVPSIYSPVPFQNSSLSYPEVCCKEMRKADMVVLSESNKIKTTIEELSNSNICYSIEIINSIIPPWVISGVCAAMNADGTSFDSIFTIDHSSMGLNIAFNLISNKLDSDATALPATKDNTFGIPDTVLVPSLRTAAVQRLSYTNGGCVAYTTS